MSSCDSCGYDKKNYTALILGKPSSEILSKKGFNRRELRPFTTKRNPETFGETAIFCGRLESKQGCCIRNDLGVAKSLSLVIKITDNETKKSFCLTMVR